jgi:segregation and condensation protein B
VSDEQAKQEIQENQVEEAQADEAVEASDSAVAVIEAEGDEAQAEDFEAPEAFDAEADEAEADATEADAEGATEGGEASDAEASDGEEAPVPRLRDLDTLLAELQGTGRTPEMLLEALLFSTHAPLNKTEIGEALGMDPGAVDHSLARLEQVLIQRGTPLGIFTRAKEKGRGQLGYILDVKAAYRRSIPIGRPVLGQALTETLALVALNQPISQSRLVRERGSTVYEHVKELLKRNWIERRKAGRSYELRTTEAFANEFGLENDPELIKRALARAAGVQGQPEVVGSHRVHFDGGEEAEGLVAEAKTVTPPPINRIAAFEAQPHVPGLVPGELPAEAAAPAPLTPAEAIAAVEAMTADAPAEEQGCVVSGGEAPPANTDVPAAEGAGADCLVSGGESPTPIRFTLDRKEASMSAASPPEPTSYDENEKTVDTGSFKRVSKLFDMIDDGSTTDDW